MAILSSLLSVSQPKGFWITIIKAFEAVTNNYVLAIIFLTVVIRVIWGLIDTGTKFNQQHMTAMQSKMQPELEKVKTKYANQPQILQQKQNEIQKKYMGKSYYGSCIVMLIVMALNLVIFFTLFSGLNSMSAYKNSVSYDSLKYTYANCLNVTDKYLNDNSTQKTYEEKLAYFEDYKNLSFVIREVEVSEGEEVSTKKVVDIVYNNDTENPLYTADYKDEKGFTTTVDVPAEEGKEATTKEITNENIIALIQKYIPVYEENEEIGSKEIKVWTYTTQGENGPVEEKLYFSTALQNIAMKNVVEVYDETKDSFLWIENIWIADSPLNKSIVSYSTLENQIGKKNIEAGEETIYNAFMPDLKEERSRANGYFIIPILVVGTALLSMFLTNLYNKRKNAKKGLPPLKQNAGWTKIIMPVLLGMFALFYNSVFAIYMLTGQIVSTLLLVPQLMIVDYFIDKKNKKEEEKNNITVDYSRKF